MMNLVTLVGRITSILENKVTIAVQRPYKNNKGIYETDFISCNIPNIFNNVLEYCKKGDIVGIKARIETDENNQLYLLSDKLSFLSSNKEET